jgi:hypothetical protein
MCRMVGFASAEARDVSPYLDALARFCASGNLVARWKKRDGGNHPDGWGIAWRDGAEIRVVRSGKPAASDPLLRQQRVRTDRFIGHVRFASNPETVHAGNSHPFLTSGVAWPTTAFTEDRGGGRCAEGQRRWSSWDRVAVGERSFEAFRHCRIAHDRDLVGVFRRAS